MRNKYLWLTPIVAAAHKIFVTGFHQNEVAHGKLIPLVISTVVFSALVFLIPFLVTIVNLIKSKLYSWQLMNKMTLYTLGLYVILFILPEIYTKITKPVLQQTITKESDNLEGNSQIPRFRNAYYGFSVSTPEKMTQVIGPKMPKGYEELYNNFEIYVFKSEASVVQLMYFDSNLETYDLEESLKSGIENQLNFVRARNVDLEFVKGDFQKPSLYCDGDFWRTGKKV